jgi:beta-lactamase superfamily II metal-dependent hydrolase
MALQYRGHRILSALAALVLAMGTAQAQSAALPTDRIAVHFINVDQGSSALLEFPCGAILIDAGGRNTVSSNHLIAYLNAFFARRTDLPKRLDAVFLTHNHDDHDRALFLVAQAIPVRGFVYNGRPSTSTSGTGRMLTHATHHSPPIPVQAITETEIAAAGTAGVAGSIVDPLACPRVDPRIRVLSGGFAGSSGDLANPNNHSLVIRVDYGDASFLFTGDLETDSIDRLLSRYSGTAARALDVDVYVVGHHGAENGTTPDLLNRVTPEIAVISMGPPRPIGGKSAWKHGHPRASTVSLLEGAITRARPVPLTVKVSTGPKHFEDHPLTDAIYGTGWDGDIVVSAGADGVLQIEAHP